MRLNKLAIAVVFFGISELSIVEASTLDQCSTAESFVGCIFDNSERAPSVEQKSKTRIEERDDCLERLKWDMAKAYALESMSETQDCLLGLPTERFSKFSDCGQHWVFEDRVRFFKSIADQRPPSIYECR